MSGKILQNDQAGKRFFDKQLTPAIKGVAIILMFALHLLKPEWMSEPDRVIDISVHGVMLSTILARGGDICIGVFAFVTGYGWADTFERKNKFARIWGGV